MTVSRLRSPLDGLMADPERYGFFQAVRLLMRKPGAGGRTLRILPELLRFGTTASLAFPPNEIASIVQADDTGTPAPYLMRVNFMGLAGPSGILPRHYTEWLIGLRQSRDHATQDFFDLFNHRLIALFWQAWAHHRPEIAFEAGFAGGIQRYVYDLVGMGTPQLYDGLGMAGSKPRRADQGKAAGKLPGHALGYYAGLISQRPHGAGSLAQIMSDYLGAPVRVEGCVGTWQRVPAGDLTRLGRKAAALGSDCLIGSRFWDRQTTLRLCAGPLRRARFEALLPKAGGQTGLLDGAVELARFLTGLALDLRINLTVAAADVPTAAPTSAPDAGQRPRLGWNTWLAGRRSRQPAEECEFQFSATGGQSWR